MKKILAKLVKERGEKETLYIKIDIYTMKRGKIRLTKIKE